MNRPPTRGVSLIMIHSINGLSFYFRLIIRKFQKWTSIYPVLHCYRSVHRPAVRLPSAMAKILSMKRFTILRPTSSFAPTKLRYALLIRPHKIVISSKSFPFFFAEWHWSIADLHYIVHNGMFEEVAKVHEQSASPTGFIFIGNKSLRYSRWCWISIELRLSKTIITKWGWYVLHPSLKFIVRNRLMNAPWNVF